MPVKLEESYVFIMNESLEEHFIYNENSDFVEAQGCVITNKIVTKTPYKSLKINDPGNMMLKVSKKKHEKYSEFVEAKIIKMVEVKMRLNFKYAKFRIKEKNQKKHCFDKI